MSFKLKYNSISVYTSENIAGSGLPDLNVGYYNSLPAPNSTLEFPLTNLSSNSIYNLQVSNTGSSDINVVGINIDPISDLFTVSGTNFTLSAGTTHNIPFKFFPVLANVPEYAIATVIVENAVNGNFFTYTMQGTGIIAQYSLQYPNGTLIDFGDIFETQTKTSSLYVTNIGLGNLVFSNIEIVGYESSEFLLSGGIPSLPYTLSAGQTRTFTLSAYNISGHYGTKNAQINFVTNVGNISYPLTARGTQYKYTSTPLAGSLLPFGNIDLSGETFNIDIYNQGNLPLILSGSTLLTNNNTYVTYPSFPISINGEDTYSFPVNISPDLNLSANNYLLSGSLTLQTNDGNYTYLLSSNFVDGDFLVLSSGEYIITSDNDFIRINS